MERSRGRSDMGLKAREIIIQFENPNSGEGRRFNRGNLKAGPDFLPQNV